MIEIIPAIDLIDGKCVRLSQGDYNQKKIYNEDPLEVAKAYEDAGIKRLHLVDLDGAKAAHIVNHRTLRRIATRTSLVIDFGGGLKTDRDLDIAFRNGAAMVTGGSIAVRQPEVFCGWLEHYGADRIILGADARDRKIAVTGWTEISDTDILPFIGHYMQHGVTQTICTDIAQDGMMQGPSLSLYRDILQQYPTLHLIASGGVSHMDDIRALDALGVPAVIVGKAIYEGAVTMQDISGWMAGSPA